MLPNSHEIPTYFPVDVLLELDKLSVKFRWKPKPEMLEKQSRREEGGRVGSP